MYKPRFDCRCINLEAMSDMKIALITARDTYNDIASNLIRMEPEKSKDAIINIQDKANTFDNLIRELEKIPPC